MRILPATLETMVGCGHSWDTGSFLTLGASVHGSKAYTESEGASPGNLTSRNSPGQTVVEMGEERSTMARCIDVTALGMSSFPMCLALIS